MAATATALSLQRSFSTHHLNSITRKSSTRNKSNFSFELWPSGIEDSGRKLRRVGGFVKCEAATEVGIAEKEKQKRSETLKNGNDSLEICRVLNGMWQTSGGWGRIDRDDAVEAMLTYADSGLTTFDMADHCKVPRTDLCQITFSPSFTSIN